MREINSRDNPHKTRFAEARRGSSIRFRSGWQRHHLLPCQLLTNKGLELFFEQLVRNGLKFGNFQTNGVLLPATERLAMRQGLPLHRGPHRIYNEMVLERVGTIEMAWSASRKGKATGLDPGGDRRRAGDANSEALERLALLQRALRRRLVRSGGRPLILNRKDPIGSNVDFAHLDAMADQLWQDSAPN